MIHSRLLRYLDEVARCGSIRKAAVTLNVAASAINRQIIALEQQLGTPLFERLPGQMRPTAAGEVLITHARETLKHHRKAIERIETLKDGRFASASIATVGGLSNDMLSYALAEYRRERPFTRFSVCVLAADDIAVQVAAGEIDLGFAFDLPETPNLTVAASMLSPCGAVVLPDHELASKAVLRLGDLRRFPLIMPPPGVMLRDHFDHACATAGLSLEPVLESNSFELLKHFALLDQGVAILNRIDVLHSHLSGAVSFIPIAELSRFTQRLSVVHRARGRLAPLPSHLLERLSSLIASQSNS
ncbi:LysR family transcriptional regulator [Mesorhizobium sp. YC-39]|uniref:LysR family transcriptional regulator n=1 Tax=unclassified Mesorhizobium TaxID=325217 RepID=UPI0021E912C8|nr:MULTISPECIES: LysR family transcriptional regulator [unclassified Mesorhizobium]MCV3209426.1 LysR family transcriptional regulator [Mesorhizobium sp. YC-2]MCV3231224.1 LysR family transcriptional regulator [Mesorhizobium sp. YC-39]